MIAYLRKAKELIEKFKLVTLQQISWEHNFKDDILSRLASLADTLLPNSVLVEVLTKSLIECNPE